MADDDRFIQANEHHRVDLLTEYSVHRYSHSTKVTAIQSPCDVLIEFLEFDYHISASVLDAYHLVCWHVRYQANRRVRTSGMIGSR